ncbi:PREDICTED: APO protein 4, mitochondrial [Tarenaya hassleriana]|uniref:APO protein 4, mitochondrial n=1 Tax=Tarenaya hassleriana TaxID=28532 RepID=UPI00053C41A0|nr:PREDICTED: APO protein 4, mitochondrial [Tarenaya hassleriana]XP_010532483.1 PREDICTED: APO protein 4, mitochondrial [Tarenaya hassleriana]
MRGSNIDLRILGTMIRKRIEEQRKDHPILHMIPVAKKVLEARRVLIQGVSLLLKVFPVLACKSCPEVFIGNEGHLIQSCRGYSGCGDNQLHEWGPGSINDILVPVEAYHLQKMSRGITKHHQRFDHDRVPAVLELCCRACAIQHEEILELSKTSEKNPYVFNEDHRTLSGENLRYVAEGTVMAWETVRACVKKLLWAYPSKVCRHCSEVHIGHNVGGKARLCCGLQGGIHVWENAHVNDLVPEKLVWHRRPQDPSVLLNECREYYGHAPAVVSLCRHAGAVVPSKYLIRMKPKGLSHPCH